MFKQNSGPRKTSLSEGATGLSGGETASGVATWGSVDYTYLRILPDGDREQRRLTDIYTAVGGVDFAINDQVLAGVALSYGRAETDGRNSRARRLDQSSDSLTISPYIGFAPTENLTFDALVGYTHSFIDTRDYNSGSKVTGSNHSRTFFSAVNVGYLIPLNDRFAVKLFSGFSGQYGKVETYRDSENTLVPGDTSPHWLARAGARAMMALTDSTQGYFSAAYEHERELIALSEKSARLSIGTASAITPGLDLTFEGTANVGRETQQELGVSANLRLSF
ncbi:autotransporter beta-domain-containing protein [Paramagnetospirillum caucaseum]|uniref:Autotransporter beta-domain-containing protein n=1 Tax=Paramagnetospirillum caucaseum TaxID=1244869 RepID=M3ABZ6_9PROT|nr:autotransporter outer membrane beta-barrel domain-containing protein [Paramagnetospirillum caucaseum]EME70313.1 autotransporter beta-domain-containing protein [Paramagnetospirillum caucaseum]